MNNGSGGFNECKTKWKHFLGTKNTLDLIEYYVCRPTNYAIAIFDSLLQFWTSVVSRMARLPICVSNDRHSHTHTHPHQIHMWPRTIQTVSGTMWHRWKLRTYANKAPHFHLWQESDRCKRLPKRVTARVLVAVDGYTRRMRTHWEQWSTRKRSRAVNASANTPLSLSHSAAVYVQRNKQGASEKKNVFFFLSSAAFKFHRSYAQRDRPQRMFPLCLCDPTSFRVACVCPSKLRHSSDPCKHTRKSPRQTSLQRHSCSNAGCQPLHRPGRWSLAVLSPS